MATISLPAFRMRPRSVVWVFAGLLLVDVCILLFVDESLKIAMTDLFYPVIGLIATAVLFYTFWKIRPVSPRFASAWFFLALGCLSWALGDVFWAVLEVILHEEPFPSIADVFYLLYYPLVIVGFLLIPHEHGGRKELITTGLDLSIVFLAAGMLYWNFLIGPVAVFEGVDFLTFLISVSYPIFDLVLFAALMLLIYRKQSVMSFGAQFFLIASVVIQIVFDTVYGLQSIAETYVGGTFIDLSWQMGKAAFGLAGVFQLQSMADGGWRNSPKKEPVVHRKIDSWLSFFPYLWLAAAYGLLVYAQYTLLPMTYQSITVVIGVMIALVLTRQLVSIFEITRISERLKLELVERQRAQELLNKYKDELEQRVRQRTADLTEANRQLTGEIEERRRAEKLLESSLHEKEVLLKEIHHRVKNNLQVIQSMLKLQANQVKDPAVMVALKDSQNRVQSMALIHEKLYQSVNLANIDFAEYIQSLISFLNRSYNSSQKQVNLRVQAEPLSLYIDMAVPCGLIVNELVSNALKHAFPDGNGGEVAIQLKAEENGRVELVVSDNGVGIPEGVDIWNSPSLGLQLVNALVNQLDGDLQFDSSQGTRFTISFSNSQPV